MIYLLPQYEEFLAKKEADKEAERKAKEAQLPQKPAAQKEKKERQPQQQQQQRQQQQQQHGKKRFNEDDNNKQKKGGGFGKNQSKKPKIDHKFQSFNGSIDDLLIIKTEMSILKVCCHH